MSDNIGNKSYKVYCHVFPDGKRYIGMTCKDVKARWNGGIGYDNQKSMFYAINKYGWDNVRHYILYDNLTKNEAAVYEAALIYNWGTYKRSKGYNSVVPNIVEAKEMNMPLFRDIKKIKIEDIRHEDLDIRRIETYEKSKLKKQRKNIKKVRCIETGDIFNNASSVDIYKYDDIDGYSKYDTSYSYANSCIRYAIKNKSSHGRYLIYSEEDITYFYIPAHWEYVEQLL